MNEKQLIFEILSLSMHLINLSIGLITLLNLQNFLCQSSDKLNYNIKIGSQITSITFQAFKMPLTHK